MPTRACTHGCVGLSISSMSCCQQTTFVGMGRSPNNTKPLRTPPGSPTNAASPVHLPHHHLTGAHPGQNTRRRPGLGHAGTAPPPRPSIYAPGLVQARLAGTPHPHASATSSPRIEKSASQPGEAVVVHRFEAASIHSICIAFYSATAI